MASTTSPALGRITQEGVERIPGSTNVLMETIAKSCGVLRGDVDRFMTDNSISVTGSGLTATVAYADVLAVLQAGSTSRDVTAV